MEKEQYEEINMQDSSIQETSAYEELQQAKENEGAAAKQAARVKAKRKGKVSHGIGFGKVVTFLLMMVCSIFLVASVVAEVLMWEMNFYDSTLKQTQRICLQNIAAEDAERLIDYIEKGSEKNAEFFCENRNLAYVSVLEVDNQKNPVENGKSWSYGDNSWKTKGYNFGYEFEEGLKNATYICTIIVNDHFEIKDSYYQLNQLALIGYGARYWIYAISFICGIVWILLFASLLTGAGYRKKDPVCHPNLETCIPFDLQIVITASILGLLFSVVEEFATVDYLSLLIAGLAALGIEAVIVYWLISLVIRIRTKHIWNGSVVQLICRVIKRGLLYCIKGIGAVLQEINYLWKAVLGILVIGLIDLILLLCTVVFRSDECFVLWCIVKLGVIAFCIYLAYMFYQLKKATSQLAAGNLTLGVSPKNMLPEMKEQLKDLESISGGISTAVDGKLASERMKTQLITNVSHDLKTPLTSVINYTDLLSKEPTNNPNIAEYTEVLNRQAVRLKRLLEDLVEASKVSAGSVEVNPEKCQPDVILSQTAAEYEDKLAAADLNLVLKLSQKDCSIMADPRHMWRVFENLLNNICKYAQPGTRVFISDEVVNDRCYFVFKNTSAMELDIAPNELMERFVRGDQSRNTEGNGLGLSIAQSLVELQNGEMHIDIDGDLFKVVLIFDVVK